jgi:alpha-amylase
LDNNTIMQYFEWYLANDCNLWNKLTSEADKLKEIGITALWLPPAYKGAGGVNDTGYGIYDLYDLGEFYQKGTIRTKYGTKEEYLAAIYALHQKGIKVYADIVLNHKVGADETEEVLAAKESYSNRNNSIEITNNIVPIMAWTKYTFPGRGNTYSDFKWNWTHFHGVDWDDRNGIQSIFKFYGKRWDEDVDKENGNYDYLMGADIDLNNLDVVNELISWGKWYTQLAHLDGYRLDAVKHIRSSFFVDWLSEMRNASSNPLFSVGEYWNVKIDTLNKYLEETQGAMSLFDVPLHYNFYDASIAGGNYDMRKILDGTLAKTNPFKAVTFVDNHDTEPGQALFSWIHDWFKPLAYAIILLRQEGIPCVFYGDYYGIPSEKIEPKNEVLDKLLFLRKHFAYGDQIDYFDHPDIIGWTRLGDIGHQNSGMAVIISDNQCGEKLMNVGSHFAGSTFIDYMGNIQDKIVIDENGNGLFKVNGGSVSVWIKE